MPDARISELPAATAPADTDLSPLVQTSGASLVTRKATLAQLRAAVLDGRSAHVRDYGAKGDGTTNDAPAIQAAITDLASKGGGTLVFAAKTYRLASAISIGSVAVKLQGQGFVEGPAPGNGTWLKVDSTGFPPPHLHRHCGARRRHRRHRLLPGPYRHAECQLGAHRL